MIHLNGSRLCAIEMFTTQKEILEIAIIALNFKCEIDKSITPFNIMFSVNDLINLDRKHSDDYLIRTQALGMTGYEAAKLFDDWFEKLKLREGKKIMPLAYNWAHKAPFIKEWLQPTYFDMYFDYRYRDPLCVANFVNDVCDRKIEHYLFPKLYLSYLCQQRKIDYVWESSSDLLGKVKSVIDLNRDMIYREMF